MQHEQAAWRSSRDMQTSYSRPLFFPCRVDSGSGICFQCAAANGEKAHIRVFSFTLDIFAFFALVFLCAFTFLFCFAATFAEQWKNLDRTTKLACPKRCFKIWVGAAAGPTSALVLLLCLYLSKTCCLWACISGRLVAAGPVYEWGLLLGLYLSAACC